MPDFCVGCRKVREIGLVVADHDLCEPCSGIFLRALAAIRISEMMEGRAA